MTGSASRVHSRSPPGGARSSAAPVRMVRLRLSAREFFDGAGVRVGEIGVADLEFQASRTMRTFRVMSPAVKGLGRK